VAAPFRAFATPFISKIFVKEGQVVEDWPPSKYWRCFWNRRESRKKNTIIGYRFQKS